jgi:hypothetical protein
MHSRVDTAWKGGLLRAQNVLLAGWGDTTFMIALLSSMEEELPKDSQVTLLNMQPKDLVLGAPASSCLLLPVNASPTCPWRGAAHARACPIRQPAQKSARCRAACKMP